MIKLLLVDKDETLTTTVSGETFVQSPSDQTPLPGVREALFLYAAAGWKIAICSNQGGVALGHKTLNAAIAEMRFCLQLFSGISEGYFCPCAPKKPGDHCWVVHRRPDFERAIDWTINWKGVDEPPYRTDFRKPNPGMLHYAMWLNTPDQVLYVGDRPEDEQAAAAAGVPFMDAAAWRGQ